MLYPVTTLYASLLGLLLIALSWGVSKNRMRAQVSLGHGDDKELKVAIRAHGNFVEYVPIALLLLLLAEMTALPAWLLHVFGIALLAGRVLHAWGISNPRNKLEGRRLGIALTWLMLLAVSLSNLVQFFI